jgi:glycosyltransferase involved in cell wall biosynthesis
MPQVSIIIPTYNGERHIRQTIDAVLAQTYRDLEVIVVDDGSTDATRDIVRSYGAPVRLIEQANARVSAARNRGIREASAPFVCFLDHDDYWYPDKLERQLREMARDESLGVVYSEFMWWRPDAAGVFPDPQTMRRDAEGTDPERSGWIYHLLLLDCWVLTSTVMFRREVLQQCGGFDETLPFSEDWDLWLRVSRRYRFAKLRAATTLYRQHPAQGSLVVRPIDYRTRLLTRAVAQWGLASPDGKALPAREFRAQLAHYHVEYGLYRLKAGQPAGAFRSFLQAWVTRPAWPKPLLYIGAAMLGWRPNWVGAKNE